MFCNGLKKPKKGIIPELKVNEYTAPKLHSVDIEPPPPKTTEYVQENLFTFVSDKDG
jgi:hypothetical protein